jgi:hypothetical protein
MKILLLSLHLFSEYRTYAKPLQVGVGTILLGSVKFNTGDPPRIPLKKEDLYSPLFKGG